MISFIFAPKSTENFGSASADAGRKRMIMDEKKALRKEIRQLKQACPPEEKLRKSASVWEKVEGMPVFREAKTVLAYWSMDDEVYTHDFVKKWAGQKTFLLPCVRGDELELRYFDGEEKLAPGEGYAIPEPVGELFTVRTRQASPSISKWWSKCPSSRTMSGWTAWFSVTGSVAIPHFVLLLRPEK